ncbi:unnamed protein product [Lymnaea stagnalis]|uniref:Uncharacterized protein n=1 Tax=Lymnaea stagnalis TaxID=6523 RepID=A0AAV2I9E3_LYMST
MIMSRRQAPLLSMPRDPTNGSRVSPSPSLPSLHVSGTCQKYRLKGKSCYTLDKMNGYCSCEPGTTCNMYEVPLDKAVQVRMIAPQRPRPGYKWVSKCEKPSA